MLRKLLAFTMLLFVLACSILASKNAHAAFASSQAWGCGEGQTITTPPGTPHACSVSPEAACQLFADEHQAQTNGAGASGGYTYSFRQPMASSNGGKVCQLFYTPGNGNSSMFIIYPTSQCPAGSTLAPASGLCSCSSGSTEVVGANGITTCSTVPPASDCGAGGPGLTMTLQPCTQSPGCTPNTIANGGYYDLGTVPGAVPAGVSCTAGCEVVFDGTSPSGSALVNGVRHWYAQGQYVRTGGACQNSVPTPGATGAIPQETCAAGQVRTEVNGHAICNNQNNGQPVPGAGPAGETTQSTTTTRTNSDGTVTDTTTTTITYPDGSQRITTTERTRPGSGTGGASSENSRTQVIGGSGSQAGGGYTGIGNSGIGSGGVNNSGTAASSDGTNCATYPNAPGCGGAPNAAGEMYTKKTRTFDTVISEARGRFVGSSFGSAATGFFAVSVGGSCSAMTFDVPYLNTTASLDFWCASYVAQWLPYLRAALLVLFAWLAFKVAVL
jgi:hypothetical protein